MNSNTTTALRVVFLIALAYAALLLLTYIAGRAGEIFARFGG